jgi:hypothetical protein
LRVLPHGSANYEGVHFATEMARGTNNFRSQQQHQLQGRYGKRRCSQQRVGADWHARKDTAADATLLHLVQAKEVGSAPSTSRRDNKGQAASWLSSQLERHITQPRCLNTKPTFACVQTTTAHSHAPKEWEVSKTEWRARSEDAKEGNGRNHNYWTNVFARSSSSEPPSQKHPDIKHKNTRKGGCRPFVFEISIWGGGGFRTSFDNAIEFKCEGST